MLITVKPYTDRKFEWIDVKAPTEQELLNLAAKYNLEETAVKDCLQPDHLPKFEAFDTVRFLIVRVYDPHSKHTDESIQQLTRKVAIFFSNHFLITVHRADLPIINNLIHAHGSSQIGHSPFDLICRLMKEAFLTFETPLLELDKEIDFYESRIFLKKRIPDLLKKLYHIKRRTYVFRKLFNLSKGVLELLATHQRSTFYEDLKDSHLRIDTMNEEVYDSINSLLNIYISLSSQKTNDVMRILTVFSAFFLPLTFIVGIYGMNFEFMPELRHPYGYPITMISMMVVTIIIYQWFKRKGYI